MAWYPWGAEAFDFAAFPVPAGGEVALTGRFHSGVIALSGPHPRIAHDVDIEEDTLNMTESAPDPALCVEGS